jgi:hypothetical protein
MPNTDLTTMTKEEVIAHYETRMDDGLKAIASVRRAAWIEGHRAGRQEGWTEKTRPLWFVICMFGSGLLGFLFWLPVLAALR